MLKPDQLVYTVMTRRTIQCLQLTEVGEGADYPVFTVIYGVHL